MRVPAVGLSQHRDGRLGRRVPREPLSDPGCRRFPDQVVVVTGAASGIGRACAVRLAAEGARVVVADRDHESGRAVVRELGEPDRHLAVAVDVTNRAGVDRAMAAVVERFGALDVLVNVAGGDAHHPAFEETDDAVWEALLDLNLLGVVRCCRAALPHLRASRRGPAIVAVSSVNALAALGSPPYSSAKAGLHALVLNLAADLAPDGIRVNAVAPGTIRTPVWDDQPDQLEVFRRLYPLGRVGEPAEVAAAVAFLASSDASWVTGHTLPVDGGLMTGWRRTGP